MTLKFNYRKHNAEANAAMLGLEKVIASSGLDKTLYALIKLRASRINHCSFCIDRHAKDLLSMGEPLERILLLPVWRETAIYTDKERAVLELTEAVTRISDAGVPEDVYERVRAHVDEKEYMDMIMAINVINSWNRIGVSTGMFPGCFG
ncbi:carboxymuconolactone decarboxylase family protein [Paenibacillus sp. y28]|uniref:carboxymuconolactone decarboxylase family protein n=1 Tax=Paenibacillus sp. y28 TaxID=3129110 RepID=UPI00301638F4